MASTASWSVKSAGQNAPFRQNRIDGGNGGQQENGTGADQAHDVLSGDVLPPGHREGVAVGEPVLRVVVGQQVHRQDAAENAGIVDEKGRLPARGKDGKDNKRQQKQGHQPDNNAKAGKNPSESDPSFQCSSFAMKMNSCSMSTGLNVGFPGTPDRFTRSSQPRGDTRLPTMAEAGMAAAS